jgi:hypothetical protein
MPAAPTVAMGDSPVVPVAFVEAAPAGNAGEIAALVSADPLALTRKGMQRYEREVREYTCVFLKQERINGELGPVQEVEVRYREAPRSVYMLWRKNADGAKRALFIDTPEFVDDDGRKAARVEPAGAVARLFVSEIMMAIDGPQAKKASRRSIAEFGFRASVRLLEDFHVLAEKAGVVDYEYAGVGEVDGRPTHVIRRTLPYEGSNSPWPDALLEMHVDQEWLLPTAIYSYADRDGKQLLGSYVFTQVKFNPGLGDAAFRF